MTVQQIAGRVVAPSGAPGARTATPPVPGGFADALERAALPGAGRGGSDVAVSAHAAERLGARGIEFTDAVRGRVSEALDALGAKGAREALLIGEGAAFVVSVPNRTVVTALAPDEMRDRVVTQIDSAVLL